MNKGNIKDAIKATIFTIIVFNSIIAPFTCYITYKYIEAFYMIYKSPNGILIQPNCADLEVKGVDIHN